MTGNECAVCAGSNAEVVSTAKGLGPKDPPFFLHRCLDCGLGWTHPKTPPSEIGRWYPPAYYGKGNVRFNRSFEYLVRLFRKRRASLIARRSEPGPVLDVGCGRGLTLGFLKSMGFSPYGIEISEEAAWHARHRMGAKVFIGDFMQAPFKKEQFHAIIFWHSLEHLDRPMQALRHAKALLKPGGQLVVAVPNFGSFQARLFGADWFHLDIPRHYFHFTQESLSKLLGGLGFKIVQTDHFNFEQNPYGWLQSFYNALGLHYNLLYSILKNRSSRAVPIRKRPIQALVIVSLLPLFLPLSIVLTLLETLLRNGGTIDVYAIKE